MNGVSLKQQEVAAEAADKAGGYWSLVQKLAKRSANAQVKTYSKARNKALAIAKVKAALASKTSSQAADQMITMNIRRDPDTGEWVVRRVKSAA